MWTVNEIELIMMSKQLQGKTIKVDERGTVDGIVASVESTEDDFVIMYVADGSEQETRFGGSWSHGTVTKKGRELYFDVPHIGTAVIQL